MWVNIVAVATALVLMVPMAGGAAYIKFDGIDGEAMDSAADGHKEWIVIESMSWSISRSRGDTTLGDVVVVRELDKSSPKLAEAARSGLPIGAVSMQARMPDSFFDIWVEAAEVTEYGITVEGDKVREHVAFSYSEVRVSYTENSARGASAPQTITFTGLQ